MNSKCIVYSNSIDIIDEVSPDIIPFDEFMDTMENIALSEITSILNHNGTISAIRVG